MEEKARYTIESFEIDEQSCIFDNKTQQRILTLVEYNYDEIVNLENLLNQQDKRIKELEQENQQLKTRLDKTINDCNNLFVENQQLKQAQNIKAIEQLERVNGVLTDTIIEVAANEIDANKLCYLEEKFYEKIDQQINELKGENFNEIKRN